MHDSVFQHPVSDLERGQQMGASVSCRLNTGSGSRIRGHGCTRFETSEFFAGQGAGGRQAGGHQKLASPHKRFDQIHNSLLLLKSWQVTMHRWVYIRVLNPSRPGGILSFREVLGFYFKA
jgi:hypothetical protein